jgi:hypothetical protein
MSAACGSEKDLWSEQISKIALRFLRFARSSLVFGGEAAELQPEFTLHSTKTKLWGKRCLFPKKTAPSWRKSRRKDGYSR